MAVTSVATTNRATTPAAAGWTDPREAIEFSVLLPNGRLAGRRFVSREEAAAWADPAAGEEVVSFSTICECEM